MYKLQIVTPWIGTGAEEDSNRPAIGDEYAIKKWEDVTGQPSANLHPEPNMYVVQAECEADVLKLIQVDAEYKIIWSEEIIDEEDSPGIISRIVTFLTVSTKPAAEVPSLSEHQELFDYLLAKNLFEVRIKDAIGYVPQDRSRKELADRLIAELKLSRKAR